MPVLLIGAVLGALRGSPRVLRGPRAGPRSAPGPPPPGVTVPGCPARLPRPPPWPAPRHHRGPRPPVSRDVAGQSPAGARPPPGRPRPRYMGAGSRRPSFTPFSASLLPWPAAMVISQSVISPVSGSAATCPRNPSQHGTALAGMPRLRIDGADHAIRGDLAGNAPPPVGPVAALGGFHIFLPGRQRQQPKRIRRSSSRCGASGPVSSASTASTSFTRALTRFSLAAGSSQSMSGLPGLGVISPGTRGRSPAAAPGAAGPPCGSRPPAG